MRITQQWIEEDSDYIRSKLIEFNIAALPEDAVQPVEKISYILRDENENILGGAIGTIKFYHLHLDFLWVDPSLRGERYGSELLSKIEEIAKEKKCRLIVLDTFSFQAPEFYKKHGYKEFGILKDHPKGFSQHFFEKRIAE